MPEHRRPQPGVFPGGLLSPEYTKEYTKLGYSINDALGKLACAGAKPDKTRYSFSQLPFGRFGEGHLAAIITDDQGFLSMQLTAHNVHSKKSNITITSGKTTSSWEDSHGKHLSNEVVARFLDANWPTHMCSDNDLIRQLATSKNPSIEDLRSAIEIIAPYTEANLISKTYTYRDIVADPLECVYAVDLTSHEIDGLVIKGEVEIQVPYSCDGLDAPITCHIVSDPLDNTQVSISYSKIYDDIQRTNLKPPANPRLLASTFSGLAEKLIQEKITTLEK